MERADAYLYKRMVQENTETPYECQIEAVHHAFRNKIIPPNIQDAVLSFAVRGRDILIDCLIDANNGARGDYKGEFSQRERYLRLAAQIAFSYGIEGVNATKKRMDYLGRYLYEYILTEECGDITE